MDDLQLVKARLSNMPISKLYELAKKSGVPYGTLWHLKMKRTKSPRYPTVKKLADFYKQQIGA